MIKVNDTKHQEIKVVAAINLYFNVNLQGHKLFAQVVNHTPGMICLCGKMKVRVRCSKENAV